MITAGPAMASVVPPPAMGGVQGGAYMQQPPVPGFYGQPQY